ncbi:MULTISPECIES: hypothetical protein [unclassified Psychromonas]|uniref:hypothetical protein n=1 Tax=unclassified Psychromonas TaxID=2614957 RepID=UPI00041A0D38|nr:MULTISPECIES: hypothetical protein [unclassified Psychromonas]
MSTNEMNLTAEDETKLSFKQNIILIILFCGIALISNWAGTGNNFLIALPGMVIIFAMILIGLGLKALIGGPLPAVAWVSLVSVGLTLPFVPYSDVMLGYLKSINFLSLTTPVLAYAAMAVADLEIKLFKKSGFKIVLISILVFTGTYVGSALVAEAFL